ncbi:MAG: aminomethyl-transferring glycine dehydrogenase subunit GcvPA [Anaerolineales bacterium]
MGKKQKVVYPYIPNSEPLIKQQMLNEIGVSSVEALYDDIPETLRVKGKMNLPEPFLSELDLVRHVEELLAQNVTCKSHLNFRGAGCYQHFVPAVCDEINGRSEFLTAYAGEPYDDHGRFQALFEYSSMMGELLEMDVVNVPTYDGFQAAATSIRMACRLTGRNEALVCGAINPDKLSMITNYCLPDISIKQIAIDRVTGKINFSALKKAISNNTAVVYFENPSYLGLISIYGADIADLAHKHGAESVVGVDPISLGVIAPPAEYGADIVCGDIQSLGMHMQFGGGQAGFIATRDEEKYLMEYPSRLFGITPTSVPGEYGFGDVAYERTSFAIREQGKEWVGTASALWGITAGVYLALIGPQGLAEIGEVIMQKSHYAARQLAAIKKVRSPMFDGPFFREFVVNFDGTGKTIAEINAALLDQGIFGGKDLSQEYPELGNCALYCVTELHRQADIDRMVAAVREIVQ